MTGINTDLLLRITQTLTHAGPPEKTERRRAATQTTANASRRTGARAAQLREIIQARVTRLPDVPNDEQLLVIAIQETLVLEFGSGISLHPRFDEVVGRVRATLAGAADTRQLLGLELPRKARD
jgi:hypothetical protein